MDAYRIEECIAQASIGLTRGKSSAKPVELFGTGASRKSNRLDAWLERFWVPLFSASARPTSAAL